MHKVFGTIATSVQLAKAVRRATGQPLVSIRGARSMVGNQCFDTPFSVTVFIAQFDNGLPVHPFTFEIEV